MTVIEYTSGGDPILSSRLLLLRRNNEIKRCKRDAPPSHYTLKIKSFSLLPEIVKNTDDKYESTEFEVAGYKWKLVLYPNGNAKRNGDGHISLYLALADTNVVSNGRHIEVELKFFVYDHIEDDYLLWTDGKIKGYHVLNTENGIDQLIPHSIFNDPRSGYLVDDCCVFGVEVHVIESTLKGEEVSIVKEGENGSFSLKIESFSSLSLEDQKEHNNEEISNVGEHKWELMPYFEVVPQLIYKFCSWK